MLLEFEEMHYFELSIALFVIAPILLSLVYLLTYTPNAFGFHSLFLVTSKNASLMLIILWAILISAYLILLAGFLVKEIKQNIFGPFYSLAPLLLSFIVILLILILSREFEGKLFGLTLRDNLFVLFMLESALTGFWFGSFRTGRLKTAFTYVPGFILLGSLAYILLCFLLPSKEPLALSLIFKISG